MMLRQSPHGVNSWSLRATIHQRSNPYKTNFSDMAGLLCGKSARNDGDTAQSKELNTVDAPQKPANQKTKNHSAAISRIAQIILLHLFAQAQVVRTEHTHLLPKFRAVVHLHRVRQFVRQHIVHQLRI